VDNCRRRMMGCRLALPTMCRQIAKEMHWLSPHYLPVRLAAALDST
jgi:hypothetical protein